MNVPAWPIPIHHTKLMIANAHPTGMLVPQTPMPVATVYVIVTARSSVSAAHTANAIRQPRPRICHGVPRTLRLSSAYVGSPTSSGSAIAHLPVPDPGQVDRARPRAQLVEDGVAAQVAAAADHLGVGVLERAELDRAGRARLLAGGHHLARRDVAA